MSWCFHDEATPATERIRNTLPFATALVPAALWGFEIWNILLGAQRRGRLSTEAIGENI